MPQPKNLVNLLGFILIALAFSCRSKNVIAINGDVKGLDAKMAYISNVYPTGSKPFDSCKVTNGRFSFQFKPDTVFEPNLVRITYNNPKLQLGVTDPYHKGNHYMDFVLERGVTVLSGDLSKDKGLNIKAGPQNAFYLQHNSLPFLYISNDSIKRKAQVQRFTNLVSAMPDAYWAMFAMNNWKFYLSKSELAKLYNTFDEPTKNSYRGRQIKNFLADRVDANALKPNHLLTDEKGNKANLIDTTKKLNMVIFWASWCGPCNLEIPSLKKIAAKYPDKNFRMVSVTIDKDKEQWKQRLTVVNMPWQQLSVENALLPQVISQYNLGWIPQIYFIDQNRKMVKYISDYNPANEAVFDQTIGDYLKAN